MEHLSTLDAGFLEAEDSDRHISLAVGGISVIDGPMPDFDSLRAAIGERILKVPRFRQVLRTHLLDLGPPEWVEAANLDLSHHIHRAALPYPGDDEALFRFAADVMERRLDRERPLWACWIIEGLPDGLTEKAVEVAKAIKFKPATFSNSNKPVNVWSEITVTFKLDQ